MKKMLAAISIIILLVIAGLFIPLRTYEEYICKVSAPQTVRLHVIKGDSIKKVKEKNKINQVDSDDGVCVFDMTPTKYTLYLL